MASYKKLFTWQKSIELTGIIYKITAVLPSSEKFNLISQMRRAVVSISSNIAEGSNRRTLKERRRYISIAYGSALELENQLEIIKVCNFIPFRDYQEAKNCTKDVLKLLNCYYKNPLPKSTKQVTC
jgi:four helix bundle protein